MSNSVKPTKLSAVQRRLKIRSEGYKRGYDQGVADTLKNFDPETTKLTEEATSIMRDMYAAESEVGNPRIAFIFKVVLDRIGYTA